MVRVAGRYELVEATMAGIEPAFDAILDALHMDGSIQDPELSYSLTAVSCLARCSLYPPERAAPHYRGVTSARVTSPPISAPALAPRSSVECR